MACGLSITGTSTSDDTSPDGGSSTSSTSSTSSSSTSGSSGDDTPDTGPIVEASVDAELDNDFVDAGGCVATIFGPKATATHLTNGAITIDGDLREWRCAQFSRLDRNHAQLLEGDPQSFVDYAIAFDDTNIYFAFRVTGIAPPSGNDTTNPYKNDSIELYLGPDDRNGGVYVSPKHFHLIVDYRNEVHRRRRALLQQRQQHRRRCRGGGRTPNRGHDVGRRVRRRRTGAGRVLR